MTDHDDLNNLPQATAIQKKRMRFSVVWIIPAVAAVVALVIAIQRILSEGPTITIVFKKAEGIEAEKTFVKYKDVNIGMVTKVELSENFSKVVLTAKIDKSAAGLIVEDAKFWIEQPRVTLSGISGIGTLMSGNYIGLEAGKSKKIQHNFVGLEVPSVVTGDQPGRQFILNADTLGSVGIGSPLYYRKLNVGQVIAYDLAQDGKSVTIKIFVNAPYDNCVTVNTRFWEASGIDVSLGANGVSVQTQSVMSLLIGGIAFETPQWAETDSKPAAADSAFTLYNDRAAAMAKRETISADYVMYFTESMRGLSVGAPVTFLGLPVGEVTEVGLECNSASENLLPRVDITLYPTRFLAHIKKSSAAEEKAQSQKERQTMIQRMVDRGLRAQLRSGNIVTGQLYVALDIFPNAPKAKIDWTKSPIELPVMPGALQDLEMKINSILAKIERMPLDAIGENIKKLLLTLDGLAKHADTETLPEVKATLESLKRLLENADTNLVGNNAPVKQDLRDSLQEITKAAQAISELLDYLERNPEALIQGKQED
ncbi:Qaraquat-inducible protein B [uncultured Desulfobacterium sp.]|uniref:Qaraquat-inducible protein B n=1 Tax=uncultured Desulfobacterium sp. TaxID=201089 RepID=A0A445N1N4_9BACT|nr:Qaraquat-inducible protein B [uncultured Desulfobacterium sp.]